MPRRLWSRFIGHWRRRAATHAPDEDPRLATFRREARRLSASGARTAVDQLLATVGSEGLDGDAVDLEVEMLHGRLEVLALEAAVTERGLPTVASQHRVIGSDACHFSAPAFSVGDAAERGGRLFLTDRRLLFAGGHTAALRWSAVHDVVVRDRGLLVAPVGGAQVREYRLNSFSDAWCAALIAGRLLDQTGRPRTDRDAPVEDDTVAMDSD